MSERTDGDRVVVSGFSAGSHFPRTQARTQFRFEADGLSSEGPFVIDGSVYGRDLRFRGPGSVAGPVMGRGDVSLQNYSPAPQRFFGGLHANGNVVAERRAAPLPQSLSGSLGAASIVVRGDVIAQHVSLENAVVFGNVRGRHVDLQHCIVLGQVLAEEAAVLSATTFLSYAAPSVCFRGPCCALFALGASDGPPVFDAFTDGAGRSWESDLRLYPVLRGEGTSPMSNRPWEEVTAGYSAAKLGPADWVRVDAERTAQRRVGGRNVDEKVAVERYVLTIAGRALNFKLLAADLERLTFMIRCVLEFDHYHPNTQAATRRRWEDICTADELALLRLATDPPARAAPAPASAPRPSAPAPAPRPAVVAPTAPKSAVVAPTTPRSAAPPPAPRPSVPAAVAPRPSAPAPAATQPRSAPTAAPRVLMAAVATVSSPAAPRAQVAPAISPLVRAQVYLVEGGSKLGWVGALDATATSLALADNEAGGSPEHLPMSQVLCIVWRAPPEVAAAFAAGVKVKVQFPSGQTVAGTSLDYDPTSSSFSVLSVGADGAMLAWIPRSKVASVTTV